MTSMQGERTAERRIPVYSRGKCVAYALVDEHDYPNAAGYRWHLARSGYPSTALRLANGRKTVARLHRIILGITHGDTSIEIDHRNGDPLDNCRANLRPLDHAENMANRSGPTSLNKSGYRGVFYDKARDKWVANIMVRGKARRARFETVEEAAETASAWRHELMPTSEMDRVPLTLPKPPKIVKPHWCGRKLHDMNDPENVYVYPDGRRRCRHCAADAQRDRTQRRKLEARDA
jgi:hypothetical protein